MSDLERIEAAMEEKVRPALRSHGGDISIDHVEGKTVYVKLLGQCAGCPSADLTNETIVEAELKAALPEGSSFGDLSAADSWEPSLTSPLYVDTVFRPKYEADTASADDE